MRNIKSVILIFILIFTLNISAKEVNITKAKTVAVNFLSKALNKSISENDILNYQEILYHSQLVIHAINFKNNLAYVLISGEDASYPVLGYVKGQTFDTAAFMPIAFKNLMEDYSRQIVNIRAQHLLQTKDIIKRWNKYSNYENSKGSLTNVGPLLTTIWSQGCYFNDSCPADPSGPCQNAVTGCVATAMSQVINYHNFPPKGSGHHSYMSNYGTLSANFGITNYNWSLMADTLNSSTSAAKVAAVSQLISHCGIAVDMMYSAGGSGAYSEDAMKAFTHYFNFDEHLQMLYRDNFPDSIWEQMLREELDSLRPVYYDGTGTGGHAFVCDGYQGDHYFHYNWGWNGSHNGYYLVTNLNPGGMNFGMYNSGVFGMKPRYPSICQSTTDTLTAPDGNFSDGSSYQDYQNNTSCSWLIQPQGAVNIKLRFYTFNLKSGDTVKVFDGSSTSAPLIGAFTGDSLPSVIASSSGTMFVLFQSDTALTTEGWSASYMTEFCQGITIFNGNSGQFSDGSANYSYHNNTNCSWIISPTSSAPIHLHFNSFLTEQGYDFVKIYDGTNTAAPLLGSFSGHNLPPDLTATSGNMLVNFISDGGMVDEGWDASYWMCDTLPFIQVVNSNSFCSGDSLLVFTSSNFDSIQWFMGNQVLSTDSFLWVNQSGNYTYRAFRQGCNWDTSMSIKLVENPLPTPNLGNDTLFCAYNLINSQTYLAPNPNNFSSWLWSTGDTTSTLIITDSMVPIVNVYYTYWVQVSDSNQCQNSDTIKVFIDACEGIEEANPLELMIFPNPSRNEINWKINAPNQLLHINLTDVNGRIIWKNKFKGNSGKINIRNITSGSYILSIQGKEFILKKIILKE